MPMKFHYIEVCGLQEERVFRPLIPIAFKYKNAKIKTHGLIDSGSDYIILPMQFAKDLGITLDHQLKFYLAAANEESLAVYKSPVKIQQILSEKGRHDIINESHVYFGNMTMPLLGQKGFLENFKVWLKGHAQQVTITA